MQHGSCDAAMSGLGQTKFRGDQRMSAIASKPDISRFLSTRPSTTLADLLTLLLPADPDLAVRTPPRA
jgi:hypothetical protein